MTALLLPTVSKNRLLGLLAVLTIAGCDPSYETTSEKCASGRDLAVRSTVTDFEVETTGNDYKLLLEDILTAYQAENGAQLLDENGDPLADQAEAQTALDNLRAKIDEFLDYEVVNGEVVSANNPIDYIEYLINTTNPDEVIDFFVSAKQQIGAAIAADDGYCDIQNRNIAIDTLDNTQDLSVTARFYFDPFSQLYTQDEQITLTETDLGDNSTTRSQFTIFSQLEGSNFDINGYSSPPLVRQAITTNAELDEQLNIDDGFDIKLGQVEFISVDTYCDADAEQRYPTSPGVDPAEYDDCVGASPRPPQKDQCRGVGDDSIDETNKIAFNTYALNANYPEIKRFRLETDFTTGEVRVYASEFVEAIYDSDGTRIIHDPTACEEQAVIDELRALDEASADPEGGPYRVTRYQDPDYDILQDDDGNDIEPSPIITFQGTVLPERQ